MKHLVLVGLSGTGKSTLAPRVAERLGWETVDLDAAIAEEAGHPVPEIFAREGEAGFRARESRILARALQGRVPRVIATGGGAVLSRANRTRMRRRGLVVHLTAPVPVLASRLAGASERPLLREDPAQALARLSRERLPLYREVAHATVRADRALEEVVQDLVALARVKDLGQGVFLAPGIAGLLPHFVAHAEGVLLVSSPPVYELVARRLEENLVRAGIPTVRALVPDGEAAKTMEVAQEVLRTAARAALSRQAAVVAVGGGTVGDLAGWVAACYMRGVQLVQVPTTLLAQVDAAIGGKVAVDLPEGKNLVGAFHPPRAVLVDPEVLDTLPVSLWQEGLAEVVKHGIIGDPRLLSRLERVSVPFPPEVRGDLLARAVAVKLRIVQKDPREQGIRAHLNLGHTFAHALEAVSGYTLRHGRAVSVGLVAASRLAARHLGFGDAERVEALLRHLGLPTALPGVDPEAVLAAMVHDKKRQAGKVRFVLPERIGRVRVVDDVPEDEVRRVLAEVCPPAGETG